MPKKRNSSKLPKVKRPRNLASRLNTFFKNFSTFSFRTKALFVFGLLFLSISLLWHFNQTIQLAFFTPKVIPVQKIYPIPTQLVIQKIAINLPIEETAINNGVWQVGEKGASHLTISARPGEKGPIILYGHNTVERLGPIRWLSKGDEVILKTKDNKTHSYTIDQTMTVAPQRLDVFTKRAGETLIIYTCDGFADLQRFVIIALPN